MQSLVESHSTGGSSNSNRRYEGERDGDTDDQASRDGPGDLYPKEAIAATFLKIDRFNERLGAIRRQLADRRHGELRLHAAADGVRRARNNHGDAESDGVEEARSSLPQPTTARQDGVHYEPIKLPRLPNAVQPPRATEPTFDGRLLSMNALRSRAAEKSQYDAAWERLQCAEQDAADAVQEADRLTEEARIAMVLYAQNERSWNFDERARRYQNVMQAKKEAEGARLKADDDRILVQCMRAQLADPYSALRSDTHIRDGRSHRCARTLEPIESSTQETVSVWILASPLLTLPFTPRDSTHQTVLAAEKELSTHVVYYAATSTMPIEAAANENDKPPSDGWLCCSNHGSIPAPSVTPVKSSIETWLVSGAGATHLNGKYLFNGTHNGTRRFKSAMGVELFRKELPKTSSILRSASNPVSALPDEDVSDTPNDSIGNPSHQLPSSLRTLERNEKDFKSMEKIGAWMSADTLQQKRRRVRDAEYRQQPGRQDGDHILTQETSSKRLESDDTVRSRQEASAEICREWVLFMHCSRRVDQQQSDSSKRKIGLGCLKRHYFISINEKETMTTWAHEQEAWLEKDVLVAIIRREAYVERISRSCQKCMSKFQQDMRAETEAAVLKLLRELNTIRFLTVKVLESIESWRAHARRQGFTRYESGAEDESSKPSKLGWSASITVNTGKKLFKGSHAFKSKFKRFCRPEDPHGLDERRLVYLGYYPTGDEAELAYDEFANSEARRLNTTSDHLPRRRSVFRSCGKHFSVESERLGPDHCIECAAKQLSAGGAATSGSASADEWNPPFFFPSGQNYILKLACDLDFLDQVPPLKNRLNNQPSVGSSPIGTFPLLGNVFLLPRTPIQDPELAFFSTLNGSGSVPYLRGSGDNQDEEQEEVVGEALDIDRILKAQQVFLQEMQIYHPEVFQYASSSLVSNQTEEKRQVDWKSVENNHGNTRRVVQALYWDRCAALRIAQERDPLPFRQQSVWCRPDLGEWASFLVRGKHQQHVEFENRLAKAGKETQERRKEVLKTIRKLLKTPLYFVPTRDVIRSVIAEGEHVRGDVVLLEVKSAYKFLDKYDAWCVKAAVIQRWYRGVRGRWRTRVTRRAMHLASLGRKRFLDGVKTIASNFYVQHVVPIAIRAAMKKLRRPVYSRTVKIDGELLVVSIHAHNCAPSGNDALVDCGQRKLPLCRGCARRFHVAARYNAQASEFQILPPVCCCSVNNPPMDPAESWVIRAYSPFSNTVYRLTIRNELLAQLLWRHTVEDGIAIAPMRASQNPLTLCKALTSSVERATIHGNYINTLATRALDEWTNWRILSDEATQRRKTAEIDLERARARVADLTKRFDIAVGDARRALDFASRPFEEAQAWDPLENANNWKQIVQKRQTQKDLAAAIDDAEQCRFELFQAHASENNLKAQSMQRRIGYESHWKPLLEHHEAVVSARTIELESHQAIAIGAMSRVCTSQLALRDTFFAPTRRALVIAPAIWHRTDTAMSRMLMIALPGLHRGRNTLRRRAMTLTDLGNNANRRCMRLIVDVSAWTGMGTAGTRNLWVSAYDPVTTHMQRVYLDWELVQLLATATVARPSRASERDRWVRIADKLMSLCMLDRFTGEFTLRKLQFYHHLRLLRPQFLASRWFQDLKRGRKCGDGDEIFRQSVTVDAKICVVVVYENWGDLVLCVYRPLSARTYKLRIPIDQVFTLLARKPLALHLWICCVKSNQYTATVITSILRFVRFSDAEDEVCVVDQRGSGARHSTVPPTWIAAKMQQKRVLLRFRDTIGGDLEVSAYDMTRNQRFRLQLEWENIRRVLKSSDVIDPSRNAGRRRNLTLTRNRRELCEWITARLCFQSLLEHPDTLASSFSPLVSGVQVRTSFLLYNEWISTSTRNPLSEVPQSQINKYAAIVDGSLFHGLAHEQLAFVSQARLPSSYDKVLLETRDFIANGSAAAVLGSAARHLKVDFYLKAHRLYARVRHEIQQEVISRREREEGRLMEKEEALAQRQEIQAISDMMASEFTKCCRALTMAQSSLTERLAKTESLFDDLAHHMREKAAALGKKKPVIRKQKAYTGMAGSSDVDSRRVVSSIKALLAQRDDPVYAILIRQSFGLGGTMRVLLKQLELVEAYVRDVSTPAHDALHANALHVIQQDSSLPLLQSTRAELLNSQRVSITVDLEYAPSEVGDSNEHQLQDPGRPTAEKPCDTEENESPSSPLSAFVLHSSGAIDEIILEANLHSMSSFADVALALSKESKPLFSQAVGSRKYSPSIQLHVQRVPLGLIVFNQLQSVETIAAPILWNPRAMALAMQPVAGVAVFVPTTTDLSASAFRDADSLYHSLTSFEPNDLLKKARPSSGSIAAPRRRTVQRSKQLLPWKQLSVERMQTARRIRQQRLRAGLLITPLDSDDERERGTLAIYATSQRHLEWMAGGSDAHSIAPNALGTVTDSLRLQKMDSWILTLDGEHRMHQLFDEQKLTQIIPCDLPMSELRFEHLRVEADNWRSPRRLMFSCQEVQSRQHYFADCSLAQLCELIGETEAQYGSLHWPIARLSTDAWRAFAVAVASKLIFRRKNGILGLDVAAGCSVSLSLAEAPRSSQLASDPSSPRATTAADQYCPSSPTASPGPNVVILDALQRAEEYELKSAIRLCRSRRFMKHQRSIRRAAAMRQCEETQAALVARRLPLEWLRITQEDWTSQENRGLLTLDEKELKKLRQAFTRVYQRRGGSTKTAQNPVAEVAQWCVDLDKEMGVKANTLDVDTHYKSDAERFLGTMERTKWWAEKHATDEALDLDVADVAEWWRQQRHPTRSGKSKD